MENNNNITDNNNQQEKEQIQPIQEYKPKRDEMGRLLKGYSGNPKGRPAISITGEIKKKLLEIPEGEKKTYLEKLIIQIFEKALKDKDTFIIKQIWNYIDGLPKQTLEQLSVVEQNIILDSKTKKKIQQFVDMEKDKL